MRFKLLVLLLVPFFVFAQEQKDSVAKKKGQFVILPNLAFAPETSLGLGFATFYNKEWGDLDETNKISSHGFYGLYTLKKQMNIGGNSDNWFGNNKNHFYVTLDYYDYPFSFYPIGGNAPDTPESYTTQYFTGSLLFEKLISKNLYLGAQIEYRNEKIVKTEEDKLLAKGAILGSKGFRVFGIAPTLTYDSRDNILYPSTGDYHLLKIRHFNKAFGDQVSFTLYDLDLRKYISLNEKKHILALNLKYLFTDTRDIPFQMLPAVGGNKIQRGYYQGRFKDTNQMVFQTDYRFPISGRIKGIVFGSVSSVSSSFANVFSAKPHPALGLGVRYRLGNDGMHIRLDFAYGNTLSPYINVNEDF